MSEPKDQQHEIYIWPVKDLLEICKEVEDHTYIDCVTLQQTLKDAYRGVLQIRLLGLWGDAYVKVTRGVEYIIFKGWPGARNYSLATRYLRSRPIVSIFVVGTKEIVEEAGKGVKVAVIAYVAFDVLEEIMQDHWSLARLGVNLTSHIAQAALATAVGTVAGVILTVAGAPVVLTFIVVVGATFIVGMGLAYLDKKYGVTKRAVEIMMDYENRLKEEASLVMRFARELKQDADSAIAALEAAREGVARARETKDRIERFLQGIPDLEDFIPYRLR